MRQFRIWYAHGYGVVGVYVVYMCKHQRQWYIFSTTTSVVVEWSDKKGNERKYKLPPRDSSMPSRVDVDVIFSLELRFGQRSPARDTILTNVLWQLTVVIMKTREARPVLEPAAMALVVVLCSVLSSSSVTSEVLGQGTNTSSSCEASRAKCFHNYQVWRIPATYGLSKRFSQQQWNGIIKKLENGRNLHFFSQHF